MEDAPVITVSGLLVTPTRIEEIDALAAAVSGVAGCAVERAVAGRLVVTAETCGVEAGRSLVERLQALPGVRAVDVVFVADAPSGAEGEEPS